MLTLDSVDNGAAFASFAKVDNLSIPGQARIAQFTFGAPMSAAGGTVLTFNFSVLAAAPTGASQLQVTRLDFGSDTSGTIPASTIPFTGSVTVSNSNASPVLNPINSQSVLVGSNISFTVSATDTDGDALTYGASPLPGTATIDPSTGAFSWTPQSGDEGPHVVTFTVDDGNGGTDSEPVTITVSSVAPPAQDAVVGSATVNQGESFDVAITYSGNAANVMGVDAILTWNPAILSANSVANGSTFSGFQHVENLTTPGQANVAQFAVGPPVTASSGQVLVINFTAIASGTTALTLSRLDFGTDTVTYPVNNVTGGSVTVQVPANNTPIMTSIGSRTVQAGINLSFTVSATDADGDVLTYGATPLPAGAMLDPVTGAFSWTPTIGQVGTYMVTFDADDGNGGIDSETVTITVTGAGGGVHDAVVGGATVNLGDSFNIAIDFSNNSADVIGVDTTLTWDPAVLTANSVANGSTFAGFQLVDNLTTPGQATVTQFGFSAVSASSGQVLVINFTALASGTSAINLTRLDFGSDASGNIPANNITNGSVTVQSTANTAPVLNPIGNRMTMEGAVLTFDVSGSDADGDSLTFAATPLAGFMSFVGTTFTAMPNFNHAGVFDVTFSVFDGTDTTTESVQITVANVNRDPVLDMIGAKSVAENATLNFTVSTSDLDGDPVTVTTSALQSWMNFDGTTFTGTPGNNDAGTYQVIFTAADGNTGTDQETVTITVTPANQAPNLNPIADKTVQEGATLDVTFTASDPDGDSLTLMFNGAEAWMSFDGTTLTLTPQAGDAGTYPVSMTASDGDLTDTETFAIIVTPLAMNMAPELDPVGNRNVDEGASLTVTLTASDPDGDTVTFDAAVLEPWMQLNGNMLTLMPGFSDAGLYTLTITADDGNLTDDEAITVTVNNVNRPPVLDPLGNQSIDEGETGEGTLTAADPDGDSLTFSIINQPAWLTLNGDMVSAAPGFDDAGIYTVTVIVSDGEFTDEETVMLTVNDVNRPPVLNNIGNQSVDEGGNLTLSITATDPDGDTVTITDGGLEPWMSFDGAAFTANPLAGDAGNYQVTFTASDGEFTDEETITVSVGDVNQAPELAPTGDQFVNEGQNLNVSVSATDPDGDSISYSAENLLPWMSFSGNILNLHPGFDDAGTYEVTVIASDGDLQDNDTVMVTVYDINRPPVLDGIGNIVVPEGGGFSIGITVSDPDLDRVVVTAEGLESWMTFNGLSFSGNPPAGSSGIYMLTFTASDGEFTDAETVTVTVEEINGPPVLDPVGNQMLTEGESRTLNFTASDPDGDSLIFNVTGGQPWMTFSGNALLLDPQTGDAGTYPLTVSVSDGLESDFEEIAVTVKAMAGNSPPVLDPIGDRTVKEGGMLMFEVSGADPDEDPLTFSADTLPEGAVFDSGDRKFTWQTQKGDAGEYDVTFTVTDGQLSDLETVTIYIVAEGFTLNVHKFPYHQSLDNGTEPVEQFSGPAVLKMILQYIWWNRFDDPEGPPALEDPQLSMQALLYTYGQPMNYAVNQELLRLDGWGLWQTIQDLDPPYDPFHYNFGLKARLVLADALRDIAEWLAYPAGGGGDNPNGHGVDGYPVHVPGAVPLYGNYDYWVVIKGIQTTVDPYRNADFGICGFWINDPHPQGLGQDTYVTAEQFTTMYYMPLTGINPDDPLYNHYVALVEPPQDESGQVTIMPSAPRLKKRVGNFLQLQTVEMEDGSQKSVYVRDHLDEDAFALIEAAVAGIQEQLVPFDDEFAALFVQTIPRKPIFVDGLRGDYYLIPFELPVDPDNVHELRSGFRKGRMLNESGDELTREDGKQIDRIPREERRRLRRQMRQRTVIIALIDAESGAFREVTWVKEPMSYLPVGKRQALRLISQYIRPDSNRRARRGIIKEMRDGAEMELIHAQGSFYYPVWRIYYEGVYYLVDQQGAVSTED
ncbi:MAG: tandem-95 repeat protein [Candidatus Omnitrophica bacterium]|nr:tandem-95 repeat protein [Candidatus Omnitrophota bacterium]MCB9722012.1 tandem-95 repeat protein [Candidatus Omnitrophota bacterium]